MKVTYRRHATGKNVHSRPDSPGVQCTSFNNNNRVLLARALQLKLNYIIVTHYAYIDLYSLRNFSRGPAWITELWQVASSPIVCYNVIPCSLVLIAGNIVSYPYCHTVSRYRIMQSLCRPSLAVGPALAICLATNQLTKHRTDVLQSGKSVHLRPVS